MLLACWFDVLCCAVLLFVGLFCSMQLHLCVLCLCLPQPVNAPARSCPCCAMLPCCSVYWCWRIRLLLHVLLLDMHPPASRALPCTTQPLALYPALPHNCRRRSASSCVLSWARRATWWLTAALLRSARSRAAGWWTARRWVDVFLRAVGCLCVRSTILGVFGRRRDLRAIVWSAARALCGGVCYHSGQA